jgi:hypothetical protein
MDATGWESSPPDEAGRIRFALAEMEFFLQAPDDRHLSLLYPLATVDPGEDANVRARGLARMAAAAARRRAAVLSFHEGTFYLHTMVDLAQTDAESIPGLCQSFLNDCDWWRQNRTPAY